MALNQQPSASLLEAVRIARVRRLAVSHDRQPATCYSYFVDGSITNPYAIETVARLAMIEDGRAPGTVVNVERDPSGSDKWEVVISHRPLTPGQSFGHDGRRTSTGGTKAEGATFEADPS